MTVDSAYYFQQLYPLQDRVLGIIGGLGTDFYLTGGTALSRVHLHHRFSDDLDLFVNFDSRFTIWSNVVLTALTGVPNWKNDITKNEEYFARVFVRQDDVTLKVELVNDVPAHVGEIRWHPVLGRVDSPENILANKLTALISREEPRDLADVWALCTQLGLAIHDAISGAMSKATGIYPPDLARRLCTATPKDWEQVLWIDPPPVEQYLADLIRLGEALILI